MAQQDKFPESPVWKFCSAAVSRSYDPFQEPFDQAATNGGYYEDLTKYSPNGRPVVRCAGNSNNLRFYYYKDDGSALTKDEKAAVKKMEKANKPWYEGLNPMNAMRSLGRARAVLDTKSRGEESNPYGQGGRRKSRRSKSKKRMTKRRR